MSALAVLREVLAVAAYRRYLLAATLLSVSLWAYQTSLAFTLLESAGSATVLGLLQTAMSVPIPLASIPSGILTDRLGPRDILVACLAGEAVCVGLTGLLAVTGALTVPAALVLAFLLGTFDGAAVIPAQVLVGRLVPAARMSAAIGFSMITIGFGRILGGPVGGALVGLGGAAAALLPACGALLAACLLLLTVPRPAPPAASRAQRLPRISDAARLARRSPSILMLILLGSVAALGFWPYLGLLPVVNRDLLGGRAVDLGWLVAAGGFGAIAAAIASDALGRALRPGRLVVIAMLAAGALIVLLGAVRSTWIALAVAALLAMAAVSHTATTNLLLQLLSPLELRGRVVALYGVAFFTCIPAGMLLGGVLADAIGVSLALTLLGSATCGAVLLAVLVDRRLLAAEPVAPGEPPPPVLAEALDEVS